MYKYIYIYICKCKNGCMQQPMSCPAEINFMGGDKPPEKLKAISNSDVIAYGESLQELVKAVGVADCLGMDLEDI